MRTASLSRLLLNGEKRLFVVNRADRIDVHRSVGRKQSRGEGDAHENHDREAKGPWVVKTFRRENDPKGLR
jgi:hypothetical protein